MWGEGGGYECTMQQSEPRHIHIMRSLGKRFDKEHVVATMKHQSS